MQVIINEQLAEIEKLMQLNKRLGNELKGNKASKNKGEGAAEKQFSKGIQ
jgi:hypothetical protein